MRKLNHHARLQVMNEWYYSNADPADVTQEVRNGGARLPARQPRSVVLGVVGSVATNVEATNGVYRGCNIWIFRDFIGFIGVSAKRFCWMIYVLMILVGDHQQRKLYITANSWVYSLIVGW